MTVTDADGATGTDAVEITVTNSAPVARAAAAPGSGPAPLQVRFTSEATDTEAGPLTYAWDFGDGGTRRRGTPRTPTPRPGPTRPR